MRTPTMSSCGSMYNDVLNAPSQPKRPGTPGHIIAPGHDRKAEPPAPRVPEVLEECGRCLLLGRQLVRCHELDRQPRQDPLFTVCAPVQHHPPKLEQVIRGGDHLVPSARLEDTRTREEVVTSPFEHGDLATRKVRLIAGCDPVQLCARHRETGDSRAARCRAA